MKNTRAITNIIWLFAVGYNVGLSYEKHASKKLLYESPAL